MAIILPPRWVVYSRKILKAKKIFFLRKKAFEKLTIQYLRAIIYKIAGDSMTFANVSRKMNMAWADRCAADSTLGGTACFSISQNCFIFRKKD